MTRLGVLLAVLGSSSKGKLIRHEHKIVEVRTQDTGQFAAASSNSEGNIIDHDFMAACRVRSRGDCSNAARALRVAKYLGLLALCFLLLPELARLFHRPGSCLCLFFIDSRVDQLHVAVALGNPSVAG